MFIIPYKIVDVIIKSNLVAVAQDIAISGKSFMISNTGAQPAYFKEKSGVAATASNAMLIPANNVFPQVLTADTLSVISNATGTNLAILILDI